MQTSPLFTKRMKIPKNQIISVLPVVSKLIERILHQQISHYIDQYLSKFLCGYRKGYNAQQAVIIMLGKWHTSLDNKGFSGAILMDL